MKVIIEKEEEFEKIKKALKGETITVIRSIKEREDIGSYFQKIQCKFT